MHSSEDFYAQASTAEPAIMMAKFDPETMLKMPAKFEKTSAQTGDFVLTQAQAPGAQQNELSPAEKLISETITAARKELAERQAKNGKVDAADLKEVMPKYFPKMKEAITLADTQAAAGRKTAADEYLRVKPDLEKFAVDFPKAFERFGKASNAVTEADGESVGSLLSELVESKTAAARKAEIRKELAKYPDLADSAEALNKMSTDAEAKFGKLYKGVEDMQNGLAQGLAIRGFYVESLNQTGADPAEIEKVKNEAKAVAQIYIRAMQAPQTLFMPPEDLQPKKPLPPLQRA
ncbi:MAG: hypothetical protein IT342_12235 [Candidatus Melainabacteria bacterium]|nr:hypothetical protein [Candidatus Melainabacteria bacterium]